MVQSENIFLNMKCFQQYILSKRNKGSFCCYLNHIFSFCKSRVMPCFMRWGKFPFCATFYIYLRNCHEGFKQWSSILSIKKRNKSPKHLLEGFYYLVSPPPPPSPLRIRTRTHTVTRTHACNHAGTPLFFSDSIEVKQNTNTKKNTPLDVHTHTLISACMLYVWYVCACETKYIYTHTHTHTYTPIWVYVCVCVRMCAMCSRMCVCVCATM